MIWESGGIAGTVVEEPEEEPDEPEEPEELEEEPEEPEEVGPDELVELAELELLPLNPAGAPPLRGPEQEVIIIELKIRMDIPILPIEFPPFLPAV